MGEAKPLVAEAPPATGADTESLAKATQNPMASLISVPIQNNSNFNVGPYDRTQDVLNIQPVIPVKLTDKWNLITRNHSSRSYGSRILNQNSGGEFGFGDMNPSFFLSPGKPGKLIWGVGPAFVIPTATKRHSWPGQVQHRAVGRPA